MQNFVINLTLEPAEQLENHQQSFPNTQYEHATLQFEKKQDHSTITHS